MTSLAELVQIFQSGALSHDAFFAQIDRALATDPTNCTRLREVLDETQTKDPLPDDVYAEVVKHIERFAATEVQFGDETRVQVAPPPVARADVPANAGETNGSSDTLGSRGEGLAASGERVKGIGDTLNGRFVLEECLGVGGMGTVYKALDLRKLEAADRKPYIAIKVLNVQFRGQPTSLIALQREARKAQTLAHRNIVTVHDFDRDGPVVYITMEYLSGSPLSRMLRAPGFAGVPHDKALPIIAGMGNALAYAHERGFVHCDFKPANVFLTDSGEVKVIDFGIARALRRPDDESEATVFDPATLGGITPAYASPEMFEHREPDPRDDVYALGCVTYELLTGRHPFNRVSALQARGEKRQPERPKDLSSRQWRTLKAALSFDRHTRTASVEQFLEGMGANAPARRTPAAQAVQTAHAGGGAVLARKRSRTTLAAGAGACVVAIAVGAAVWYGYRGGQPGADIARDRQPVSGVASAGAPSSASTSSTGVVVQRAAPSPAELPRVLASLPCSALSASVQGSSVSVRGYVGERDGLAHLRDALAGMTGAGVADANLDVRSVGENECDVVKAFAPFWVSTHQAASIASGTSIRTKARNGQLTEGSPLVLDLTTPGYDTYVSVDYYVLDGSVVHLVPSRREKDNQAPPNYSATIGGMGEWVIAKPLGSEMIVLVATPVPLFETLRPESEPRAAYLAAVDARLKAIAGKYGEGRIAVDFAPITTRPAGH
jgi:hypothetical protein